MNKKVLVLLLLYTTSLYPSFPKNTLITTQKTYTAIQKLSKQNAITSLDLENSQPSTNRLHYLLSVPTNSIYKITLPNNTITCSAHQFFYDPQQNVWVPAQALNTKSCFLDY